MNGFRIKQQLFLVMSLLVNSLCGRAQSVCPASVALETGGFTAPARVCAGQSFTLTGTPASLKNVSYYFRYDGNGLPAGSAGTSNPVTAYTAPGSYTILQLAAGSDATGTFACRVVEVLPTKAISFSTTSCSNRLVTLTYTLDDETIKYNTLTVNWADGSIDIVPLNGVSRTATLQHTYSSAGNNIVQVTGSYTGACDGLPATQTVRVQGGTISNPVVREVTSSATSVAINYQGPDGFNLELYRKDASGTFVPTSQTGTSGTFTIQASPTVVSCFQLVAKDACGTSERRSTEVCTLPLTVQAEDGRNVLSWPAYSGTGGTFRLYRAYKNGPPAFSANNRLATEFIDDKTIFCGQQYCYVLEAVVNNATTSSQTTIRSLSTCVSGINNTSVVAPLSVNVSVQPNGVNVQANLPATGTPSPYTLIVSRSGGPAEAMAVLGTSTDRTYSDATAQTNSQSYCYQVALRNRCGVVSKPTLPACTILLTRTNSGTLRWTSSSPFSAGKPQSYLLIFINPVTGASDKLNLGNVTEFRPDPDSQVTQYQIAAVNNSGIESYSNPVQIELGLKLFIPNAFTPSGDNPLFMAKGIFWETFEMTIFSRWGDVVFNTTDKNTTGWNGDIGGAPGPAGYYVYKIRVTDPQGVAHERTGQVMLLR